MNSLSVDQRIAELLDDPLISLMIQADRVDRQVLANDLRSLDRRRDGGKSTNPSAPQLQAGFSAALAVEPPPVAHVAAATRTPSSFGICTQ